MQNSNRNALLWCYRTTRSLLRVFEMRHGTKATRRLGRWQPSCAICYCNGMARCPRTPTLNAAFTTLLKLPFHSTMVVRLFVTPVVLLQAFSSVMVVALGDSLCHLVSLSLIAWFYRSALDPEVHSVTWSLFPSHSAHPLLRHLPLCIHLCFCLSLRISSSPLCASAPLCIAPPCFHPPMTYPGSSICHTNDSD